MSKLLSGLRRSIGLILLAGTLVTGGLGCSSSITPAPATAKAATITMWGVLEDEDAYADEIAAYRALHPNVTIEFRKFRLDEYEKELLNAFAEDRGPDVFMVHNTWMRAYQPKLLPLPKTTKVAFREIQGVNSKPTWVEKTVAGLSVSRLRDQFIDQVAKDVVVNAPVAGQEGANAEQVFALPLAVDTLALYYNKDALNAAGIPTPAQSWAELQDHVKRLVKYDEQGKLRRPAIGLGTFKNVDRAMDILSLLMIQNGAKMADDNGLPTFNSRPAGLERETTPGAEALAYYTDFANPAKEVFTWDDTQPNSFDAFISGQTAYFLGYEYHLARIRAQAPKLNFGVTSAPQVDPQNFRRNFANYWAFGVSKKTAKADLAWNFIQFLASEAQVKSYLAKTGKPTGLRSLIPTQVSDGDLAPFASQLLTAESWYRGVNVLAAEAAFADMVQSTLSGGDPQQALNLAADTVSQTVR